jgi:D-xylose transport system ATP-binding protein
VILTAAGLTKRFPGVTALSDVSFDLRAGEIHALCGENGAGKSTLIKLLAGVYRHGSYEGRIEVAGEEARFRSIRDASAAGIAVIHQELALVEQMSVAENIFLGTEPTRCGIFVDRRAAERAAAAVLGNFGVALDPATPVAALGVGEKQLVEIVKALARNSRILILDEPTAALAEHEVETLLRILGELRTRGVACIYISHRLAEVFRIADRVTVLRDGRTVATLPAAEVDESTVVRLMVGREVSDLYAHPAAPRGATLLAVEGLAVMGPGRESLLREVSFELRAGEVLGVGGLMGAGRTELLMHLFGAWGRRVAGRVVLGSQSLPAGDPHAALAAGLALVTEDRRRYGLVLGESIAFNLSLSSLASLSRAGIIAGRMEAASNRHWFAALGIRATGLDAIVGRLSGGNQQKVVLGKALMTRPRVVMLDEPTRGIDIGAKLEIYRLINGLTASGCGVLLVSSELPELIGISDRILMLHAGTISACFDRNSATPERLLRAALGGAAGRGRGTTASGAPAVHQNGDSALSAPP